MRTILLFCCVAALSVSSLEAAQFAPRVSAREIALNDSIRISFTTGRPQLPEVDRSATVRNALALRSVQDSWRVIGEPVLEQHERALDVTVIIRLAPRLPGRLNLPQIPVAWMLGEHVVNLGAVTVRPEIRVGGDSRPLPVELTSIAGFTWGMTLDKLRSQLPAEAIDPGPPPRIQPRDGLHLQLVGGQLARATLSTEGLEKVQARSSLVDRWGHPSHECDERIEWHVGWLHIVMTAVNGVLKLEFQHGRIQAEGLRAEIQRQVFGALEEDLRQPEEAKDAVDPDTSEVPDPFEAEFERRLRQQ